MRRFTSRVLPIALGAATIIAVGAASSTATFASTAQPAAQGFVGSPGGGSHDVYVSTNSSSGNAVQVFERQPGGSLVLQGSPVSTGGVGSGAAGSQGSVTLSPDGRTLLVVNEGTGTLGSSTVSDFAVGRNGQLTLRNTVSSGGLTPVSVTIRGNLVVVLNAGSATVPGSVVGFAALHLGLVRIAGGSQPLPFVGGANSLEEVTFSPSASEVVVTDKGLDTINTFAVAGNGRLGPVVTTPGDDPGAATYAAAFADQQLLVVDAGNPSAVSPYVLAANGTLTATQSALPNAQNAACWIAVGTHNDAFVDNADNASVSSYIVLNDGTLAFVGNTALTGAVTPKPLDDAVSSNGRNLYVLDEANNQIDSFVIGDNGRLTPEGTPASVLGGPLGIAAS
jgi:6-phosphogluconolactonase